MVDETMWFYTSFFLTIIIYTKCYGQRLYASDIYFRIEPGSQMCVFETGIAGQMMEVYYQVLDGQHGELDISFEVTDPKAKKLIIDTKSSGNLIILDLDMDGDYSFCMDNSYSLINSKLVFLYILIEDKSSMGDVEVVEEVVDSEGDEEEQVLEWGGIDENGEMYYIEVRRMVDSLSLTLRHVLKLRHLLNIHSATKSRDSYIVFEDTFIVDVWSCIQISLICVLGMIQVYMIKRMFIRNINFEYECVY